MGLVWEKPMYRGQEDTKGLSYLDLSRPYVSWAAYRGTLITPPREKAGGVRLVSWWYCDLLRNGWHLERELELERIRELHFPDKISRLVGLFCFLDEMSSKRALAWKGHFRQENLATLDLGDARRCGRKDANWISRTGQLDDESTLDWMERYWRGEAYPYDPPIWETPVEGKIRILYTSFRKRAYANVARC